MKPGELVAARMSGGIAVAMVVEVDASRVRVAVRRKREARLPSERIILSTQIVVSNEEELAAFRERVELLAADIGPRRSMGSGVRRTNGVHAGRPRRSLLGIRRGRGAADCAAYLRRQRRFAFRERQVGPIRRARPQQSKRRLPAAAAAPKTPPMPMRLPQR